MWIWSSRLKRWLSSVPEYINQFSGSSAAFSSRSQVTGVNDGVMPPPDPEVRSCAADNWADASSATTMANRFIFAVSFVAYFQQPANQSTAIWVAASKLSV